MDLARSSHLFLCWFLFLALSTSTTEGRPFGGNLDLTKNISDTVQKMKDVISHGLNSIFSRPAKPANMMVEQPSITSTSTSTSTQLPEIDTRQIIVVPVRCPAYHVLVNDKCRLIVD